MNTIHPIVVPVTSLPLMWFCGQATYMESGPSSAVSSEPCPRCAKPYHYDAHRVPFPIEIDRSFGIIGDLLTNGSTGIVLSRKAWLSMRRGGIKGLDDAVGIESIKKLPKSCPHSKFVFINPSIGPWRIDYAASGVITDGPCCDTCGAPCASFDRLVVEPESFDESAIDICIPQNMRAQLVCSYRFMDFVKRKKLIGFAFVPGDAFCFDQFKSWEM